MHSPPISSFRRVEMSAPDPKNVLAGLWRAAGQDEAALDNVELTGAEPVLPSSFAVGTAAQATIAAAALAAGELWRLRSGRRQRVSVDMRAAAIEFRSERYLRVNGKVPDEYHDNIAGLYRCGDGRWVRLHTNLPHHCSGLLALLGCEHDREAVQRTLEGWKAEKLEDAAAEAGLVVTACRSFAEWDAHPQGQAIASCRSSPSSRSATRPRNLCPRRNVRSPASKCSTSRASLPGRCAAGRLPAHGADVLLITAAHLPSMLPLVIDTGRGKLSASLDLREAKRTRHARRAGARRRRFRSRLSARRRRRAMASALRRSPGCGRESSMSRSAPTATKGPGRSGAASTRWCKPQAD